MNQRDLAYWMQGYFEITNTRRGLSDSEGPPTPFVELDAGQWPIVEAHVNLVEHDEGEAGPLTIGLRLACETKNTQFARKLVASYFQHVVDPLDPHPESSQAVHDAVKPVTPPFRPPLDPTHNWDRPPSDMKARC